MALGRKETNEGVFHDEEIAFYKGLSLDEFYEQQHEAQKKMERLVTLLKYLEWLRSTQNLPKHVVPKQVGQLIDKLPFSVTELKIQPEELVWLFDTQLYAQFLRDFARETVVSQWSMLFMKARKFRAYSSLYSEVYNGNCK